MVFQKTLFAYFSFSQQFQGPQLQKATKKTCELTKLFVRPSAVKQKSTLTVLAESQTGKPGKILPGLQGLGWVSFKEGLTMQEIG